ncbi:hypothetical protein SEPL_442 [Salmonella phage SE_PL]|nr:hypothetical protein 7t3_0113 [Salmonella phage 7t3]QIG63055.1 hypothetical protein SEPL_442 [Salmonella phage SE_PL]
MSGFIFTVVVTCIVCAISYYYLHIHPEGAFSKKKSPSKPVVDEDYVNNFWK